MRIHGFVSPFAGVVLGAGYGLAARWLIRDPGPHGHEITYTFTGVSIAFLFLVPFALGMLTAALGPRNLSSGVRWVHALFMPWVSVGLMLVAACALALEGAICILMASPILVAMGMLGGATVAAVVTIRQGRSAPRPMVVVALVLPFLVGPVESRLPAADDLRTVTTTVDIDAPPEAVWRNVVRVPLIRDDEQTTGLFQKVGIPRPLEATLDRDGVGGLREARFAGGIRFHERITEWTPERQLGFTIAADADSIPAEVLDAHVRVGGENFDVVFGRFTLSPHGSGTRLVLESNHHLRTHLNFYAHHWTDAVMRDIQSNICRVIRRRAEGARPAI